MKTTRKQEILEECDYAVELYAQGRSLAYLAERYGVSYAYLEQHIWPEIKERGLVTAEVEENHKANAGKWRKRKVKRLHNPNLVAALVCEMGLDEVLLSVAIFDGNEKVVQSLRNNNIQVSKDFKTTQLVSALKERHAWAGYTELMQAVLGDRFVEGFIQTFGDYKLSPTQIAGVDYALSQLNERQREVIRLRYFSPKKPTLAELASEWGTGKQRMSQIEYKALRLLRAPALVQYYIQGYDESVNESTATAKDLVLSGELDWQDVSLEDLNLSKRAYNALRRAGIRKLGEVTDTSRLLKIRNFGNKCLEELRNKFNEFGAELPE